MGKKYSFDKDRIKVLLLEGIHKSATEFFNSRGYHNIESYPNAFDDDLLKEKISTCLLYTSPSPRDRTRSRMPSSA